MNSLAVLPVSLIYAGAEQLYDGRLWGSSFEVKISLENIFFFGWLLKENIP